MISNINIEPQTIVLGVIINSMMSTIIQYIYEIIDLIMNIFIKNIELNNNEHKIIFNEFLLYIKENCKVIKSAGEINITNYQIIDNIFGFEKQISKEKGYAFGIGVHYILYKRRLIKLHIYENNGYENNGYNKLKKCYISILGSINIIKDLIEDIEYRIEKSNKLQIGIGNKDPYGRIDYKLKDKREINTVIINEDVKKAIYNDFEWFLNNKQWYIQKGIHYHRGYLLYGLPGTGKTSLIMALGSEFNIPIINASINNIEHAIKGIKSQTIIVIEDIDRSEQMIDDEPEKVILSIDENKKKNPQDKFRKLLQIMDGFETPDDVIFILTANDITKLDSVIFRCGRIDMKIEFKSADYEQAKKMFLRFFPEETQLAERFGKEFKKIIGKEDCVPADIQDKIIEYVKKDNVLGIFENSEKSEI